MQRDAITRYARHLVLKEIGGPGQQALLASRIAIIGAGGLGGPAGLYLAAAGIGQITVIDDDVVDLSNLQRQIQFTEADIGKPKAAVMGKALTALNPDITVTAIDKRLDDTNAAALMSGHDIILDGTDSFKARFAVNRAAHALGIALVSGALGRFDAQVSLFAPSADSPCYQCLVPEIPPHIETCSEVGIVGALAGITGSRMALETIKYITGAGTSLAGKLWIFDGLSGASRLVSLPKDPACPVCGH